ncbi:MAG: helix-turn-helix domain-containing GNAT family N-acetyltransferase [Acidimicrobiia bacterium]|nr:helix-turn-helix domain-containing GNAT family N-acetyltransferase [Acidimicrobiia bacterium]
MTGAVDVLRGFNRRFTQRIGVLEDRFLGLDRPLASSRLLWEIGLDGRAVGDIRQTLGVDSAYLSRLLRQLESEGLVVTEPVPTDGRRRRATLTESGRREWQELDRRSQVLAETLIAPLGVGQRQRLAEALITADRLLSAAAVTIEPVDPADSAAVESLRRYFGELDERFETGFDEADSVTADADFYRPPRGAFLLAHHGDDAVACGAVHRLTPDIAEIKRMWVNPDWRGIGLGRRILERLEQEGRSLGCTVVRLDTNSVLTEAIAMYRSAGYEPIDRYNDNPFAKCWFEKRF